MKPPGSKRPPTVVYVQKPVRGGRAGNKAISAGWWTLIFGFIVACIPFVGLLAWLIGAFLCLAAFVLAIVGMAQGRTLGGIFLLCGALIGAPLAYAITPLISAAIGAESLPETPPAKEQP